MSFYCFFSTCCVCFGRVCVFQMLKHKIFCKGGQLLEVNYVAVLIFYNGEKGF